MGLLCDYFVAPSDDEAAATVDWVGGPSRPPEPQRRLFRRQPKVEGLPTVPLPGIDPAVMMGTLESLLTGRAYDDVVHDPSGHQVAIRRGGERLVWALTESLQAALIDADGTRLREVALEWVQTEEFLGQGDPMIAERGLSALADLVRASRSKGSRLYCWLCV
jgi:hypothetical protein